MNFYWPRDFTALYGIKKPNKPNNLHPLCTNYARFALHTWQITQQICTEWSTETSEQGKNREKTKRLPFACSWKFDLKFNDEKKAEQKNGQWNNCNAISCMDYGVLCTVHVSAYQAVCAPHECVWICISLWHRRRSQWPSHLQQCENTCAHTKLYKNIAYKCGSAIDIRRCLIVPWH